MHCFNYLSNVYCMPDGKWTSTIEPSRWISILGATTWVGWVLAFSLLPLSFWSWPVSLLPFSPSVLTTQASLQWRKLHSLHSLPSFGLCLCPLLASACFHSWTHSWPLLIPGSYVFQEGFSNDQAFWHTTTVLFRRTHKGFFFIRVITIQ